MHLFFTQILKLILCWSFSLPLGVFFSTTKSCLLSTGNTTYFCFYLSNTSVSIPISICTNTKVFNIKMH